MADKVQSMFSAREVPWHRKGTITKDCLTADQAIKAAGLDWKVELHPAAVSFEVNGKQKSIVVPDRYAVIKKDVLGAVPDPDNILGIVGSRYVPIQNDQLFCFFDPVVERNEAIYETGGALLGGRVVWLLAKLDRQYYTPGVPDDQINLYVLLTAAHDGSMNVVALSTPVRVVCWNTWSCALRGSGNKVSIRHSGDVEAKLAGAHKVLGLATRNTSKLMELAGRLVSKKPGTKFVKRFLKRFIPSLPEKDGGDPSKVAVRNRERVEVLFVSAETNNLPGMERSLWALFNAYAEWIDHEWSSRAGTDELHRSWLGTGAARKEAAFKFMLKEG